MPIYYHIHRGIKKSNLEKGFKKNKPLFFSKKNSFWYEIEKKIGRENFDGYIIYKIDIPSNRFTTSFNPRSNNKIVKITKKNIKKYIALLSKYKSRKNFIIEMNNRNIIGIDITTEFRDSRKRFMHRITPEGFIWKKTSDIKINRM